MISNLLMATGSQALISTVDMVDPFGDGSGIALYKFDGDATDESGAYNGTETSVTYADGKFGQCAVFNGSSSYVNPSQVTSIATDISFSLWVKLTSIPSGNLQASLFEVNIRYINSTTMNGGLCCVFGSSGKLELYGKTYNGSTYAYSTYNTTLPIGQYAHVICIFSKTLGRSLYVDGVLQIPTVVISPNDVEVLDFSKFYIGKNVNTNAIYTGTSINGSIDQVRIFNRAITAEEVTALYEESVDSYTPYVAPQGFFNDGTEVAHYKFDGDALDSTGSYDGTATNVTYATGKFGQCAVFNGSSSKIGSSIPSLNEVSISLWANMTDATYSNGAYIFSIGYNSSNSIILFVNDLGRTLSLSANAGYYSQTTSNGIVLNQFYHIVAIINNSGSKLYLDGALVISGNTTISTPFPSNFELGYATTRNSTTSWFGGSIDQVRIFNRELTQEEVTALYNEGQ